MDFTPGVILHTLLDTLSFGVVVLNAERKPLLVNTRAARLIGEGKVFHTDYAGTLRVAYADADKRLTDSINALHCGLAARRIYPVSIRSHENRSPIFAWVSALPMGGQEAALSNCAGSERFTSLFITEKSGNEAANSVLADMFDLTPAEARLLHCLLKGISPSEYAVRRNLSQNTVRNQLKSIFAKTDVRRQSDLVSLVSDLMAPVDFGIAAVDG